MEGLCTHGDTRLITQRNTVSCWAVFSLSKQTSPRGICSFTVSVWCSVWTTSVPDNYKGRCSLLAAAAAAASNRVSTATATVHSSREKPAVHANLSRGRPVGLLSHPEYQSKVYKCLALCHSAHSLPAVHCRDQASSCWAVHLNNSGGITECSVFKTEHLKSSGGITVSTDPVICGESIHAVPGYMWWDARLSRHTGRRPGSLEGLPCKDSSIIPGRGAGLYRRPIMRPQGSVKGI